MAMDKFLDFSTGKLLFGKFNIANLTGSLGISIDGAGSAITPGIKGYLAVPFACTIVSWYLVADVAAGSIEIDVWKKAGGIPDAGNTIAGSELPTLSSVQLNSNTNPTSWSTHAVAAGDVFGFNVNSCTGKKKVTLCIGVNK
jgi:hypothetical protein